ncbi:MAG TPA: hypothetical protein PKD85_15365 [Saprospiraceae bacterium]|nr:hypothetical protein [Saprospiraceae bacterium]
MRLRSLSWLLSLPLVIATCAIAALYWGDGSGHFIYILIPLLPLLAIYFAKGQIDFWYLQKYPYPLDNRIISWLEKYDIYYLTLDQELQKLYRDRLSNYLFAREMLIVANKETREIPEDIKAVIASQCIKITLGHEDFLLGDFDRIYCYTHPFPTPKLPSLHLYEVDKEDQMIILSMDNAVKGVIDSSFFNIALQSYLEAYISLHPNKDYPLVHDLGWTIPEQIFGLKRDELLKYLGNDIADILALHMNAYFTNKEAYSKQLPKIAYSFQRIFNQ